jgi:hypothetical protein
MPAGNPEAYAMMGPPGAAMQQMLESPLQVMQRHPHGDMANMLLQALGGQPQQSVSQAAIPTAEIIRPQPAPQMPQLSERDIAQFGQMDRDTVMATRQALQQRGWLTPEVDTHFSKRLQQLQMQQSRGK